jgi:hypothetical protein
MEQSSDFGMEVSEHAVAAPLYGMLTPAARRPGTLTPPPNVIARHYFEDANCLQGQAS